MKQIIQSVILVLLLSIMGSTILFAQESMSSDLENKQEQRRISAKMLVELDKASKSNYRTNSNRNNGRNPKGARPIAGFPVPSDYDVVALNLQTKWFQWNATMGDVDIPNPIPYLQSLKSQWSAALYSNNSQYLRPTSTFIQDDELLLPISDLSDGRYFIEIEHNGSYYSTDLAIGNVSPLPNMPSETVSGNNSQKHVALIGEMLEELDKTPKANNRNNGRKNRGGCCPSGISALFNNQVLAIDVTTSWYLRGELSGMDGLPNPIPYLQNISSSWDVLLFDGNANFIAAKAAYVQDNELLLSIAGLAKGTYFLEIEHDGAYYATGFSIGRTGTPPVSTIQQSKN